ncbi:MAG: plasmid pRiA4b ORF-3 family protein, partial [Cyanobacteria bacterium Co-bin8]|nr:plasmid pRiA4b ORF-3 family protein [Cyanobacteria bacterium Co-bin8]
VELVDSYPLIWRCFQVPASLTLKQLHLVLQAVMGWPGTAPHSFKVNGQQYGPAGNSESEDESAIALSDIFSSNPQPCFYTYNPQEGWLHRLELDEALVAQPDQSYPHCLDGQRACPPEQSGGVWGYEDFLERLNDPEEPDYAELWEQVGLDFDPERFDPQAVNQHLQAITLS